MFKRYVEYLKDNPEGFWFKRKLYGWGWTPATKEGWFVILVFIILIVGLSFVFNPEEHPVRYIIAFVALVIILLRITYMKGEKPRWRWGLLKKDEEDQQQP